MTENNDKSAAPSDSQDQEGKPAPESSGPNGPAAAETPAPDPLQQLSAERDKLREQLLRTAADFDNYRKRTKRDVDEARQRGKDDLVRELLPVFDNLERAVQTADSAKDLSSVVEGVRMVLKLFEDTAERTGLSRVKSVGERFDPAVHEAIQQQETDAHPPGTIIAEIVPGYRFGQRLVRPAMVVVARKPSEPSPPAGKPNGSGADTAADAAAKADAQPSAAAGSDDRGGATPKDSREPE